MSPPRQANPRGVRLADRARCVVGLSLLSWLFVASTQNFVVTLRSSLDTQPGAFLPQRRRADSHRGSLSRIQLQAARRDGSAAASEWFTLKGSEVEFGARGPINVQLAGTAEKGEQWLLGADEGDDSVDRLIKAAKPGGARVEDARQTKYEDPAIRSYYLHLPPVEVPGLGTAKVSVIVWGAIRESGGPQSDSGPYLEVGSDRGPEAVLELATGQKVTMPTFNLAISGALGIEPTSGSSGISSTEAVGWVKVDISSEVPAPFGLMPPEMVLKEAARTVCRATLSFASDKLSRDLSLEFSKWSRQRRREKVSR